MAQDENTPPITPDPAADLALASAIKSPRRSRLLPVLLSLNVLLLMGACAFVYMTYVAGGESPLGPSEAVASSEAAATADSDAPAEPAGPAKNPEAPAAGKPAAAPAEKPAPVAAEKPTAAPAEKPPAVPAAKPAPARPAPAVNETDDAAKETAEKDGASWAVAERAFDARRYSDALKIYAGLLRQAEKNTSNRFVADLLRLRVAECLRHTDRSREARTNFLAVADSGSPIIRAIACHRLAWMDALEGQPMLARMRAYRALGALGAMASRPLLETDCEFLAAQAVTCRAVAFLNGNLPWPCELQDDTDIFKGLNESDLTRLLEEGADRLASAALGPQIKRSPRSQGPSRWSAISSGAPVEEVLGRIAAESGTEIRYDGIERSARRRPVNLCVSGTNEQRLVEVVCGSAGLVARFTGSETIICDPLSYTSTATAQDLLVREAVSSWRRFFLKATDDARLAQGHFSLGLLNERAGDAGAALTEFELIAMRFPNTRLAPLARLHTATLRIELRDYAGARKELLDLLDSYPDCPSSDEVYLRLGQATMEGGQLNEAALTFKKLYFLNLSLASRAGGALGAGQCHFRAGRYEEAAMWLARRLELGRSPAIDGDLYEAYSLLAKTEAARNRLSEAVAAYRQSLGASPKNPQRVETLLELAKIFVQQDNFLAAMGVLQNLSPKDVTPKQADEILLSKASILRSMHLPERAQTLLQSGMKSASSPESGARMTLELARSLADCGESEAARRLLADLMPKADAALAQTASLELAEMSLRSGHNVQAIAVCRQILKSSCPEETRQTARQVLGRAYAAEKDYDRAAMALSGLLPDEKGAPKP